METTFWDDFTIADAFGEDAIRDTYNRAFKEWKTNYKYFTELVIVLNHKIWEYYDSDNDAYSKLYDELWQKADGYAVDNFKGDELSYYFMVTD